MTSKQFLHIWVVSLVLLFTACVPDKPKEPTPATPNLEGKRIYIANEGSLGNGNASLSFINLDQDSIYNNVYAQKNGNDLGDILQSVFVDGDRIYLAVNNSDKVVVLRKSDFSLLAEISVPKPRYFLKVNDHEIYVSSLYHPKIFILNTQSLALTGEIITDFANTEGMVLLGNKAYVCNWDTACGYIYEINTHQKAIAERIPIAGSAPQQIVLDKNNQLWVVAGNVFKQKRATLTQINPESRQITQAYTYPQGADIMKPCFNAGRDTLYFLGVDYNGGTAYNGLYRMSIVAHELPDQPFIAAEPLQYFWGVAIDALTHRIYLCDPKGFVQKGAVSVFLPNGDKQRTYQVGIGPSHIFME